MRAFRADPLSVLGQACAAVLCCSVLLRGRSLQTRPEQAPALLLTDTHRGMLSPRGLETSVSLSESLSVCAMQMHQRILAKMYAYRAETAAASFSTHTHTHTHAQTHTFKAHTIPDLYIFNSIHPPPAPPPLFPVFVWSYCFNLAASGGP